MVFQDLSAVQVKQIQLIEKNVYILGNTFILEKNDFLHRDVLGYYHQFYRGYKEPGNPHAVNVVKNTFKSEKKEMLIESGNAILGALMEDLPSIIRENDLLHCAILCVPRAKSLKNYSPSQLIFRQAVTFAAKNLNLINGVEYIVRTMDTRTTHLKNDTSGALPYVGITKETCYLDKENINGKDIILIDDIYTKTINIDEDCIQALFDNGARSVIFYCIGYTQRWN